MASHADDYLAPRFTALAHRGGSLLPANVGIENTVRAFRNATALGLRYLETDVHATADGQLVAFHDAELTRVTDQPGRIADLSLRQLRTARVGGREPIPLLDELLEEFPTCRFNLDIKAPGAVDPLARAIRRHKADKRVCVGSFSQSRLNRFRGLLPEVTTAVPPRDVIALARGRVVRRPSTAPRVYQVPLTHRLGPVTVPVLTRKRVAAIHAVGMKVHVWTVNEGEQMLELLDWEVDGIVTDRPDVLKAVLTARGMWSTRHGT